MISLEEALNNVACINLGEVSKSIIYIPLETTPESLVGEIGDGIVYDGEYIYIKSRTAIKIFDKEGKYIRTIDRSGRGPEEYTPGFNFSLSPLNGNIVIGTHSSIKEYDMIGNFIKKIDLPKVEGYNVIDPRIIADNSYVASLAIGKYDREHFAVIYDSLLTIQAMLPTPDLYGMDRTVVKTQDPLSSEMNFYAVISAKIFRYDNSVRIFYPETKEVFTTTGNNLDTAFVVDYGKYRLPGGLVNDVTPDDDYISLNSFVETKNYLFITAVMRNSLSRSSGNFGNILYDKHLSKSYVLHDKEDKKNGFRDDMEGGPLFWPRSVFGQNTLISYVNPIVLKEYAEEGNSMSEKLSRIVAELKEDSNPVIVVVELKK